MAVITHSVCYIGCLSQWQRSLWFGNTAARLLGLSVWNPFGEVEALLLWLLCVVRQSSLLLADQPCRGVLPSVVCLSVIKEARGRSVIRRRISSHGTENSTISHVTMPCPIGLNSLNICESREEVPNKLKFKFEQYILQLN